MGKSECLLRSAVAMLLVALSVDALMFNLQPNLQKCLRDEMQAHQLIVGEYEVSDAPGQYVHYVVSNGEEEEPGWYVFGFHISGKLLELGRSHV